MNDNTTNELRGKISFDTSEVDKGIPAVTKSIQTFAKTANQAGVEVREAFGDPLKDALAKARLASDRLTASTGEQRTSIDVLGISYAKLNVAEREQIGLLTEQLEINASLTAELKAAATATAQQEAITLELNQALQAAQIEYAKLAGAGRLEVVALTELKTAYAELLPEQQEQVVAIAAQQAANERLTVVQGAFNSVARLAPGLLLQIATAAVAASVVIVKTAADYEQTIQRLQAKTGLSDSDTSRASGNVKTLAESTGIDPDKVAAAFEIAYKETQSYSDALQIETVASKKAVGAGDDLTQVTSTLATLMHETGQRVGAAGPLLNLLTVATHHSKLEMSDFGDQFTKTAAAAHAMHVPITDVSAAVETLRGRGLSASQAFTVVGQILHGISQPSKEAIQTIDYLSQSHKGLKEAVSASGLAHRGLIGSIDAISAATGHDTDAQDMLFHSFRVQTGALILLNSGHEEYHKHLTENADALAGRVTPLEDDYNKALETTDTKMSQLAVSGKEFAASIGDLVAPALKTAADNAREVLDGLRGIQETVNLGKYGDAVNLRDHADQMGLYILQLKKARSLQAQGVGNPDMDIAANALKMQGSNVQPINNDLGRALLVAGLGADSTKKQFDEGIRRIETMREQWLSQANAAMSGWKADGQKAAPNNAAADADTLNTFMGDDDGAFNDFKAKLDAWNKAHKDAAAQTKAGIREAARNAKEIDRSYQQFFNTLKGVETDKWSQKAFTLNDQASNLLDLIGDPKAITQLGQEVEKALHEALSKIHQEAVTGRAEIAAKATFEQQAPLHEAMGRMLKGDSGIGDPAEIARKWAESNRAMIDAGDETKVAARDQAKFMADAYVEAGEQGGVAWSVFAEEVKRLNKEIAVDSKATGKIIAHSWAESLAGTKGSLDELSAWSKRVREEAGRQLSEQSAETQRISQGLAELDAHINRSSGNRSDDAYRDDTLAKFGLVGKPLTAEMTKGVETYWHAWQRFDILEEHRRQIEEIAGTIRGTLSEALEQSFEKPKVTIHGILQDIEKDTLTTLKRIAAKTVADNATRGIMSLLGHAPGKAGDYFNAGELKSAAQAAASALGPVAAELQKAADDLKELARQTGGGQLPTTLPSTTAQPIVFDENDNPISTSGGASPAANSAGVDPSLLRSANAGLQGAASAKSGDIGGVVDAAGSLAAAHAMYAGGFGSSLAGLSRAMPWIGLGLGVDNLLGDPVGKLLSHLFRTHLHLAGGTWEVPGSGFSDSVPAMLTPGEAVLDRGTAGAVRRLLSGGGLGDGGDMHFHGNVNISDAADMARVRSATARQRETKFRLAGGRA